MEDYLLLELVEALKRTHAVNDFRKLCNIEAYSPVDNISEITAKLMMMDLKQFLTISQAK